ncbi:MAG: hypothetical protein IKT59_03310 [Bacteroidales bacterium]|nr:hypothetical protein [Bacteroidales bacterium]
MAKYSFQKAVEKTTGISSGYRPGVHALKKSDRSTIVVADTRLLDGSVDIDTAVQEKYPNENRWDYAIGYSGKVCYVEVHPAYTSEVSVVENKLKWLKTWLKEKAPLLDAIPKAIPAFVWAQTGKGAILPQSSQAKRLATLGIKVTRVHKLQ